MKKRILALVTVVILVAMTVLPAVAAPACSVCVYFETGSVGNTSGVLPYNASSHRIVLYDIRRCFFGDSIALVEIGTLGYESHSYSLVRDNGHPNGGKFHDYRVRCTCGYETNIGHFCAGPPCKLIYNAAPDQIN